MPIENEEILEWEPKDFEEFVNNYKDYTLEHEILKAHGKEKINLLYAILDSTSKLTQAISVVAGFGFTALGHVNNNLFFIFGEFLLFIAILLGLIWVQKIYKTNFDNTTTEMKRMQGLFKLVHNKFKKIYNNGINGLENGNPITIPTRLITELMKERTNLMENFSKEAENKEEWNPLELVWILFAGGTIGILLSFIDFYNICFIKFL